MMMHFLCVSVYRLPFVSFVCELMLSSFCLPGLDFDNAFSLWWLSTYWRCPQFVLIIYLLTICMSSFLVNFFGLSPSCCFADCLYIPSSCITVLLFASLCAACLPVYIGTDHPCYTCRCRGSWGGGEQNAQVLSVWGDGERGLQNGVSRERLVRFFLFILSLCFIFWTSSGDSLACI